MSTRTAEMRDSVMLAAACIAGAVIVPVVPFVGLPLSAAALAGLYHRGSRSVMVVALLLALLATWAIWPVETLLVAPSLLAVMLAIPALKRRHALSVTTWFVPVLGVALAARQFGEAWLSGLSLRQYFERAFEEAAGLMNTIGANALVAEDAVGTMLRLAPSTFMLMAVATAAPTLVVLLWVARRTGSETHRPVPVAVVDLSPHVLWLPVAGVAAAAAARVWGGTEGLASAVSMNLLLAAKAALFVQGFAVIASLLRLSGAKPGRFVFVAIVALLIDGPTWVISFVGLLDFWMNFRKLERDGIEGPEATRSPHAGDEGL